MRIPHTSKLPNEPSPTIEHCNVTWPIMKMAQNMKLCIMLFAALALCAQIEQQPQPSFPPEGPPHDIRLPNGKSQRQEMLKADYKKTLEDARQLSKLADELKTGLEKNDYNVLSLDTLKKTDEIDKLARKIRDRLKRN